MKCSLRPLVLGIVFLVAGPAVLTPRSTLAQHGGGHSGGGHFGGGHPGGHFGGSEGHSLSAPPVSAPHMPARVSQPLIAGVGPHGILFSARPGGTSRSPILRIFPWRRHPRHPIQPIFGGSGFFGVPFFGFGSPFFGLGFNGYMGPNCDPYWDWGFGCDVLPYYPLGGLGYLPAPPEQMPPQLYVPAPVSQFSVETKPVHAQLYLKDGTVYDVTDYWLVGGKLHFITVNPDTAEQTEHVIDFDDLDLQKSVDMNTQRGFRFVLRPEPLEKYLRNQQNPSANPSPPPPQPGPAPTDVPPVP